MIAFTYFGRLGREELGRALQALLPADIGLGPLRRVAADFRPRYRARRREYRYQIWNGPPSPLRERYALGVREQLDIAAMAAAAQAVRRPARLLRLRRPGRQPVRTVDRVRSPSNGSAGHRRSLSVTPSCARWSAGSSPRCCASGHGQATAAEVAAALARRQSRRSTGDTAAATGLSSGQVPWAGTEERKMARQDKMTTMTGHTVRERARSSAAGSWSTPPASVSACVASRVAVVLEGKHKPTFATHIDTGDHVIVLNAAKIDRRAIRPTEAVLRATVAIPAAFARRPLVSCSRAGPKRSSVAP